MADTEDYKDFIEEYVGFEIDWEDPPGPAAIALQMIEENIDTSMSGVTAESIDDLSRSYGSAEEFYRDVLKPLHTIRRFKWP